MNPIQATIVIVRRGNELLLGEKVSKVGKGCLVAPGGKVEIDEDLVSSAIRETVTESGITPVLDTHPVGWLHCRNLADDSRYDVAVFVTEQWSGAPSDSPELRRVGWYPINAGTIARMMEGDILWLKYALTNQSFGIEITYDEQWRVFSSSIKLGSVEEAPS